MKTVGIEFKTIGIPAVRTGIQGIAQDLRDVNQQLTAFGRTVAQGINLATTALNNLQGAASGTIASLTAVQQHVQGINTAAANAAHNLNAMTAAQGKGGGQGGGPGGNGAKSPKVPGANGPFTRLINLQQALGLPQSYSPQQALRMNQIAALNSAQSQVNQALGVKTAPPVGQRIASFLTSSQVGGGGALGDLTSLVGQLGEMADIAPEVIVPLQIAAKAVELLGQAAESARNALTELTMAAATSGGSSAEVGRADVLGRAVGGSSADVASDARRLYSQVGNGGMAASIAAQYGYRAVNGFGQKVDKLGMALDLIRSIVNDPNERRANLAAQTLGLEKYLPLRAASPEYKSLLSQPQRGPTPGQARDLANFNIALGYLGSIIQSIVTSFGAPLLGTAAKWMKNIGDYLKDAAPQFELLGRAVAWLVDISPLGMIVNMLPAFRSLIEGIWKGIQWLGDEIFSLPFLNRFKKTWDSFFNTWGPEAPQQNSHGQAIDDNTDAINRNTAALDSVRRVIGGGDRAHGAIPNGWQAGNFNYFQRSQARALGAFAL